MSASLVATGPRSPHQAQSSPRVGGADQFSLKSLHARSWAASCGVFLRASLSCPEQNSSRPFHAESRGSHDLPSSSAASVVTTASAIAPSSATRSSRRSRFSDGFSVRADDKTPHRTGCRYVDSFTVVREPDISLPRYCEHLQQTFEIDNNIVTVAVTLVLRVCRAVESQETHHHQHSEGRECGAAVGVVELSKFNTHRLLLAAMVVATKAYTDVAYTMDYYARPNGISRDELMGLEVAFMSLLQFQLWVDADEASAVVAHITANAHTW